MPFLNSAILLDCQLVEHFSKMPAQLPVQHLTSPLRDKHHMVFALPSRMAQTLYPVHRDSSFKRVLGGSRSEVSTMDTPDSYSRKCQTSTVTPAEPGDYLFYLYAIALCGSWEPNTPGYPIRLSLNYACLALRIFTDGNELHLVTQIFWRLLLLPRCSYSHIRSCSM